MTLHGTDANAEAEKKPQFTETDIFSWQHVDYTVPIAGHEDRKLLSDVSGYVAPGKLTALMGESGAGKTTLLNVLAQRVSVGVVSGDRFVNGQALPRDFQSQTCVHGISTRILSPDLSDYAAATASRWTLIFRLPRSEKLCSSLPIYVNLLRFRLQRKKHSKSFPSSVSGRMFTLRMNPVLKSVCECVDLRLMPMLLLALWALNFANEPQSVLNWRPKYVWYNVCRLLASYIIPSRSCCYFWMNQHQGLIHKALGVLCPSSGALPTTAKQFCARA